MPTISDFQYGYDNSGVETYIEEIKAKYLNEAKSALEDISSIKACCEQEWEGHARDNFVQNLEHDAKHVGEQYEHLYIALVNEIKDLNAAMANKDETLIQS